MLLPTTYAITLAVLIFATLCWGSWANTLKKSSWRFEVYYIDFAIGALLLAVVAAYTVGSMGSEISVQDNYLLSSKTQMIYAFMAGCVMNLALMMFVAAVDLGGMAVAGSIVFGLALVVGAIWNYIGTQTGSVAALAGGSVLALLSVVTATFAKGKLEGIRSRLAAAAKLLEEPPAEALAPGKKKRVEQSTGPGPLRGVWLAIPAGLLFGAFYPAVGLSMEGELGLSNPFALMLIFSIGMFVSTFIYNLYFMNLPVKGLPISVFAYFTGTLGQHAMGLLGGMLWMAGACALLIALAAQGEAKVVPSIAKAFGYGAGMLSLFWGVTIWKEFAEGDGGVKRLLAITLLLLAGGIVLTAMAPQL